MLILSNFSISWDALTCPSSSLVIEISLSSPTFCSHLHLLKSSHLQDSDQSQLSGDACHLFRESMASAVAAHPLPGPARHWLSHLGLTTVLWGSFCSWPHFTGRETEVQEVAQGLSHKQRREQVRQRKTNIIWYRYVESKKQGTTELIYKTEIELQRWKINLWLPDSKGGGINWKIGIDTYTQLYIKE